MRILEGLFDFIFDWYVLNWIFKNPIVIPFILINFIPYFFLSDLFDFVESWGITYISSSTIVVLGIIGYTLLVVTIIIVLAIRIDDEKK